MSEESNRIALQEYLDALQVVARYHRQLMDESKTKRQLTGMSVTDFLRSESLESNITIRLEHILVEYRKYFDDCNINDVIKSDFLKIRNAGEKSWSEFERARLDYTNRIDRNFNSGSLSGL
jgi:hypothetical protein